MFDFAWLFDGQFRFLDNPLVVAIIIVLTTMIIFYFVMHEEVEISDLLWTGLYSAVAVYVITALHYRNLIKEFDSKTESVKGAGVIDNISASVAGGGLIPALAPMMSAQSAPPVVYVVQSAPPVAASTPVIAQPAVLAPQ
jgi:hypothetical protein